MDETYPIAMPGYANEPEEDLAKLVAFLLEDLQPDVTG